MKRIAIVGGQVFKWLSVCALVWAGGLASGQETIAYWPFGDYGFADASGNGSSLVTDGIGVALGGDGQVVLDGTLTAFNTSKAVNLSAYSAYTVECFMRTPVAQTSTEIFMELSRNYNDCYGAFYLDINDAAPMGVTSAYKAQEGFNTHSTTANVLGDGAWHHVALVVDLSASGADRAALYFDGVKQGTCWGMSSAGNETLPADQSLFIGSRANNQYKFIGELDEIRITAGALTPDQFLQARNTMKGNAKYKTVAFWPFGAHGGADISGNGNDLLTSGVAFTNGTAVFDGSQTKCSTMWPLDLRGYSDGMTFECWAKTTETAEEMIVEHCEYPGGIPLRAGAFYLDIGETGAGRMRTMFRGKEGFHVNDTANGFADGAWHHVAITYAQSFGSAERAKMYVDGIAVPTNAVYQADGLDGLRNGYLYFGSESNASDKFIGELDDVRITAGILTTNEFHLTRTVDSGAVAAYWPFGTVAGFTATGATVESNAAKVVTGGTMTSTEAFALPAGSLTAECFVRVGSEDASGALVRLGEGTGEGAFTLRLDGGAILGSFGMNGGSNAEATVSGAVGDGEWHHVALVYDAASNAADRVRLYLDGMRQAHIADALGDTMAGFASGAVTLFDAAGSGTIELDDVRLTTAALAPAAFQIARSGAARSRLLAQWKFTVGGQLEDETGAFNLLEKNADDVFFKDGAAMFHGHNGLYTQGAIDLSPFDAVTIECVARMGSSTNSMLLLEQSANYNDKAGAFAFSTAMLSARPGLGVRTPTGYNIQECAAGILDDGNWHHLAYVLDRANTGEDWAKFYLDGVYVGQRTGMNALATEFAREKLFIGFRGGASRERLDTAYFGELDDVRITAAALSPGDFLSVSNRTADAATDDVIACWTFDDGTATDTTGHGYSLDVTGDVSLGSKTAVFGASHGRLRSAAKLPLSGCTAYTVECYARTRKNGNQMFFHTGTYSGGGEFYMGFEGTYVHSCASLGNGNYHMDIGDSGCSAYADGCWHHYAAVWNLVKTGNDFGKLYIDGVLQNRQGFAASALKMFVDATICLGDYVNGAGYEFEGELDNVRVTGRELTPAEFMPLPKDTLPEAIAYWPFDPRGPLADATGNGHTLENGTGGAAFNQKLCTMAFSGSTQTVFRTADKLDLRGYDALTLEFFARTDSTNAMVLAEFTDNADIKSGAFYMFLLEGKAHQMYNTDTYMLFVDNKWTRLYNHDACKESTTDGRWHHYAIVIDKAAAGDDRAVLYVDYVPQVAINSGIIWDRDAVFPCDRLNFGLRRDGKLWPFIGELDDVRLTGAALAPSEFLHARSNSAPTVLQLR